MAKWRQLPVPRPRCQCGALVWVQGEGSGRFRRNGAWAKGRWFRFSCPGYRLGGSGTHFHAAIDIDGQPVELTRRHFRVQLAGRPKCSGEVSSGEDCRELLTAHRKLKTAAAGEYRYFVCTNIRCDGYGEYRAHMKTGPGWKRVILPRGPRVVDFGVDRCPNCGEKGTLRSRGRFGKTRQYPQRLRRVRCNACGSVFRQTPGGKLKKAPPPGFQWAHAPPRCSRHGEMTRSSNSRRPHLGIIYRWRCPRKRCQETALLDRTGKPVPPKEPPRKPSVAFGCKMPGCEELRADQLDGRKRYCVNHTRLSYFLRWKLKRRLLRAMNRDESSRSDTKTFRGSRLLGDEDRRKSFGRLLRQELMRRNLTPGAAARKTSLPVGTVQNWSRGVSLPRDKRKFERLARGLGIDLAQFGGYLMAG